VIAWLLGIVHHQAVKSLRRRPLPLTPALAEDLPSQQPLPEDEVQAGDRVGQVREALQHLSHEHRAALELIFYQKLSYEEAAQVCGCPLGTMKSRVSQARLQMKGLLNRLEVEQ
jgi:RNA polymerase sigma-70 factor (ECF subfamily)